MKCLVLSFLAALVLSVSGCEPAAPGSGLLDPHRGGLVSQAGLEGGLLSSSTVAAAPAAPAPVERENQPEDGLAAVEEPASAGSDAEAEGSGAVAGAQPAGEPLPSSSGSPGPPPAQSDELSSGEYGGGAVVVQQPASVATQPDAESSASGGADAEPPSEAAVPPAPADPSPEPMPGSGSSDSFDLPQGVNLSGGGGVDLDAVLPPNPSSDQPALDVLGSLARRPRTSSAAAPSQPCAPGDSGLLAVSLGQLSMVRAWLDGTTLRAELRGPDGRLYTVVRGDRVGGDGGRVLQVSSSRVVVGEIGFGLDGTPFIIQEAIRERP